MFLDEMTTKASNDVGDSKNKFSKNYDLQWDKTGHFLHSSLMPLKKEMSWLWYLWIFTENNIVKTYSYWL